MATATSAFTPLSVPPHEDTMDMSSPARRQHDEDIDIDIDFTYGDDTLVDDDQMLDDEQMRPHTATDTAMDDDAGQEVTLVPEADMVDDPSAFVPQVDVVEEEDDDLIDYGDDDYLVDEPTQEVEPEEHTVPLTVPEQQQDATHDTENEGAAPKSGDATAVESELFDTLEDVNHNDSVGSDHDRTRSLSPSSDEGHESTTGNHDNMPVEQLVGNVDPVEELSPEEEAAEATEYYQDQHVDSAVPAIGEAAQAAISVNTHVSRASDEPATPTDTGLHPMILQFGDAKLPLFRSRHQPQGLLTNDNLVGHHLADLISNCRERLQVTNGTVFSENQECTLQFQGLPLELRESSKAAYKCTLNDVLNVYLHLHHNASTEAIPPLFLTLTTPESFTDVLQSLKVAAESGQGIPNVQYYQADEEEEQYVDEADVGQCFVEDSLDTQDHEQHPQGVEADEVEDEEFYLEGDTYDDQGEYEAADQEEVQHLEYDGSDQGGDFGGQSDEAAIKDMSAKESSLVAPTTSKERSTSDKQIDSHSASSEAANAPNVVNGQDPKALSPGSSATAQDDHRDNTDGECAPDLETDWGEDDFLIDDPSDATDNSKAEVPAVTVDVNSGVEARTGDSTKAGKAHVTASEEHGAVHDLASDQSEAGEAPVEDFDDLDNPEADEVDGQEEEDFAHGATYDQADTDDGQQEDHHPGEDDEQHHTARDFLNGETRAHEPEVRDHMGDDARAEDGRPPALETFDDPNELIDFDDDTPAEHEARKASPLLTPVAASDSPLGKRSFDEHAEEDLFDDDDDKPDLKKKRSR